MKLCDCCRKLKDDKELEDVTITLKRCKTACGAEVNADQLVRDIMALGPMSADGVAQPVPHVARKRKTPMPAALAGIDFAPPEGMGL